MPALQFEVEFCPGNFSIEYECGNRICEDGSRYFSMAVSSRFGSSTWPMSGPELGLPLEFVASGLSICNSSGSSVCSLLSVSHTLVVLYELTDIVVGWYNLRVISRSALNKAGDIVSILIVIEVFQRTLCAFKKNSLRFSSLSFQGCRKAVTRKMNSVRRPYSKISV